jgi:hypothetical protein
MLAYTIYITGTRKFLPDEGKISSSYQRDAYKDAREHFMKRMTDAATVATEEISLSPSPPSSSSSSSSSSSAAASSSSSSIPSSRVEVTGARKAEHIHGHFYINIHNEEERRLLDDLFLNPVIHVGEVVAGDEKLFHYTAHHMNTKAIPQKKDVCVYCNTSLIFLFF